MKNLILYICYALVFFSASVKAQNVALLSVEKTVENHDKTFLNVSDVENEGTYLATLEVDGFNSDDATVFNKIYKKAKEVGANQFALHQQKNLEGQALPLNPGNYQLDLFYQADNAVNREQNVVFVLNASDQTRKISWDGEKIELNPRSYLKKNLLPGKIHALSTRKFLGSGIRLSAQEHHRIQYFEIGGARLQSNQQGQPGINFKSADFIALEPSYGSFLTCIYKENN